MIRAQAPARICLFGDHQDYLNLPVIAASINQYIYIEAQPNQQGVLNFNLSDLGIKRQVALLPTQVEKGDYLCSTLSVLHANHITLTSGYDINIHSEIPVNAGVSSSSALIVALIRFILQVTETKASNLQIANWAHQAEVEFFNEPGGIMDHYSIALGGLRLIEPKTKFTEEFSSPHTDLLLVHSGLPKSTLGVLGKAKQYALEAVSEVTKHHPEFRLESAIKSDIKTFKPILSSLLFPYFEAAIENHLITKEAVGIYKNGAKNDTTSKQLEQLMERHQYYLDTAIKNTPELMRIQMNEAKKAGAKAVKVMGSGGGGCFIILAHKENHEEIISAVLAQKAKFVKPIQITSH
jgi:galactokinase